MKYSESILKIAPALVAIQSEIKNVVKDKANPYFSSTYADLAQVLEVARPILSKNKVALIQFVETPEGKPATVTSRLIHESGEWIETELALTLPAPIGDSRQQNTAQKLGALYTYLRRYSILALLAMAAEDEDDDAEKLENKTVKAEVQPAKGGKKPVEKEMTVQGRLKLLPQDLKDLFVKAGAVSDTNQYHILRDVAWDLKKAREICIKQIQNQG